MSGVGVSSDSVGTVNPPSRHAAPENSRVRVLEQIAERYHELVDPLSKAGVPGDGDSAGLLRMPSTYTPAVREFERLVKLLHTERPDLWRHLDGWWLSATSRTVWHCPRCGVCHQPEHTHPHRKTGRLSTLKCRRVVVYRRVAGAQERLAGDAIVWMAGRWGLPVEPFLPKELQVAA